MTANEIRQLLRELAAAADEVRWYLYGGWAGVVLFIIALKGW